MGRMTGRVRGAVPARRGGRLVGGLALAVVLGAGGAHALGVGGAAPEATDAAWTREEAGVLGAAAGQVAPAVTTCDGNTGGRPHVLHLDAPDEGLEVTAFRVIVAVGDGDDGGTEDDEVPGAWSTGETSGGVPYVAANTPTVVPADAGAVAWGITTGWSYTWRGTATVTALGPGGWESEPVEYTWSIGFGLLGEAYSSCTAV